MIFQTVKNIQTKFILFGMNIYKNHYQHLGTKTFKSYMQYISIVTSL